MTAGENMSNFETIYAAIRHLTIVPPKRCEMLYRLSTYASVLAGDIAEVGVYRGGTSLLLAAANPAKTVHSFDTFAGIPNASPEAGDRHHNGDFGEVHVRRTVRRLRAAGIKVHRGCFPDTARGMKGPFCFAHFDGDTYRSCKDFLSFFWPKMAVGGVMLFDDWRWHRCPGVEKAVLEHCRVYGSWPFHTAPHQVAITVCRSQEA